MCFPSTRMQGWGAGEQHYWKLCAVDIELLLALQYSNSLSKPRTASKCQLQICSVKLNFSRSSLRGMRVWNFDLHGCKEFIVTRITWLEKRKISVSALIGISIAILNSNWITIRPISRAVPVVERTGRKRKCCFRACKLRFEFFLTDSNQPVFTFSFGMNAL